MRRQDSPENMLMLMKVERGRLNMGWVGSIKGNNGLESARLEQGSNQKVQKTEPFETTHL